MDGKAMIVCMSRRICIDLYGELTRVRPDWCHGEDTEGWIKVVMTGTAADPPSLAVALPHQVAPRSAGEAVP